VICGKEIAHAIVPHVTIQESVLLAKQMRQCKPGQTRRVTTIMTAVHVTRAGAENVAAIMVLALVHVTSVPDLRIVNAQNAQLTLSGKTEHVRVMHHVTSS